MKKYRPIATTLLLALGMLVVPALGQEDEPGRPRRRDRGARANRGEARLDRIIQSLNLTEGQKEPVAQKLKTHQDAVQNYQKENREDMQAARKAMQEARQSGDKEAIAAAEKALKVHQDALRRLRGDLEKQLADVLTPEQMTKFKAGVVGLGARGAGGPGARFARALGAVGLTPEQIEKIRKDILTPAQRARLEQALRSGPAAGPAAGPARARGGMMAGLDLTDEQQKKIEAIRAEYREKIRGAEGRDDRRKVMGEMREAIAAVLTDEQREKMQKQRAERGGRRGGGRRRGGQGQGGQD